MHEFDLQIQQEFGRGTVFQSATSDALARELPNFLDVNLNPVQQIVTMTVADTTGKGPLGPTGTVSPGAHLHQLWQYRLSWGRPRPTSRPSRSTSATSTPATTPWSAEIQNRSLKNLQFDVNYTWSHALDFDQNASTAGNTNNWYDPYSNARSNYGNSTWDTPNRLVAYALYKFPNAGNQRLDEALTNDWSLDTTFQMQNGLPYTAGVSGTTSSSSILADWNGNGSVTYVPQLGHNNYFFPRDIVVDARVQKQFAITERYKLTIFLQAYNVANHQNVTAVFTPAYKIAKSAANALSGVATYQSNFGQTELHKQQRIQLHAASTGTCGSVLLLTSTK